MIFEFIVIIVSIVLLVFHLEFFVIILLSLLFIHRIFVTLKKENKPNIHKKYFITPSSLSSKLLTELLNSNVLEGEFHILSKASVNNQNELTLKNIRMMKKKGNIIYSNIENRITDILSYSYKNNLILIVNEEKIPKNLIKMFNIRIIDISSILEEKKEELRGRKLKVEITEKVEDGYYCKRKDLKDVIIFLKNGEYPLNIGEEIDVEVENIFETPQKRIIYVKRSY
ncbi:MAG: hypothetical protein QME48_03470 [bacterium]|nr:hypothetical protein [bacterium]